MPLFAIIARDHPGSAGERRAELAAHLRHIEQVMGQIAVAGPLRDGTGEITGSLLVVHADDAEAAARLLRQDPYHAAGIWASTEVHAFNAVAGDWVGGKTW